ncbi:Probable lipoprotein precursor [Flavobacterium indicum GPTSA100-9 = DSM 17447]|uniref:Probable lipoprotein n=1 Tax=Flavobacterium indicum (strain DSM 17447 / CIP 109464 / GPTSA100-9) TaxID=1094466 RepID=H8XPQ3_FLAIG|nr:DUF4136 domain-containing protein [Flavobacterium indicum]CCG54119.1 Probable lipoprotein precursor [Flavobacterium indicum GPTSA100-9 = DSM 17447]
MKTLKLLSVVGIFFLISCSSVRVNADYDKKANFSAYKSYAYFKSGIDKAEISDLDKKRILYAIDDAMATKGFTKSESPDVLISIFTKEREVIDVYQNYGWGWGWGPWGLGYNRTISTPEGTLFIDIFDAKTKELVWQGQGTGYLTTNTDKKEERIKEFVSRILEQYPPSIKQ